MHNSGEAEENQHGKLIGNRDCIGLGGSMKKDYIIGS